MILQKLASAIRRQDWFQVVIEVLIVIVGIFLGLQVQSWYDSQSAQQDERRVVAHQECHQFGDVFGLAYAAERVGCRSDGI